MTSKNIVQNEVEIFQNYIINNSKKEKYENPQDHLSFSFSFLINSSKERMKPEMGNRAKKVIINKKKVRLRSQLVNQLYSRLCF